MEKVTFPSCRIPANICEAIQKLHLFPRKVPTEAGLCRPYLEDLPLGFCGDAQVTHCLQRLLKTILYKRAAVRTACRQQKQRPPTDETIHLGVFLQTPAAMRTSGRASSSTPFSAGLWLHSSSGTQGALSISITDYPPSAPAVTNLVKDVEVPLVNGLAGHPRLLQQICLHRCSHQQLGTRQEQHVERISSSYYYSMQIRHSFCNHLSSWSWMYFPKRLLLLFLSVQALPTSHWSLKVLQLEV